MTLHPWICSRYGICVAGEKRRDRFFSINFVILFSIFTHCARLISHVALFPISSILQ
jgi:hypothetical protein